MYWEKGQCEPVSETRSWAAGLDHVTQEFSTKRQELGCAATKSLPSLAAPPEPGQNLRQSPGVVMVRYVSIASAVG